MKALSDLQLPRQLWSALQETKRRISAEFAVDRIVLFGSVVRGEADEERGDQVRSCLRGWRRPVNLLREGHCPVGVQLHSDRPRAPPVLEPVAAGNREIVSRGGTKEIRESVRSARRNSLRRRHGLQCLQDAGAIVEAVRAHQSQRSVFIGTGSIVINGGVRGIQAGPSR